MNIPRTVVHDSVSCLWCRHLVEAVIYIFHGRITSERTSMAETFTFFWKSPLSQWQRAPFVIGGIRFTHAEQFMMYAKSVLFGDHEAAERILQAATPREQKAIGRTVRGFDEGVWTLFREGIVYNANYARFSQNP